MVLGDDTEDVVFANQLVLLTIDLHLGAAVGAEENHVADGDFERSRITCVVLLARAERDDLSLLGLFLGGVWDDDTTTDLFFFLEMLHEHAISDGLDSYFSHIDLYLGFERLIISELGGWKKHADREKSQPARFKI